MLTGKGHLGKDDEVEVLRVALGEDPIGPRQVIVDIADLGVKLDAGDPHLGRRASGSLPALSSGSPPPPRGALDSGDECIVRKPVCSRKRDTSRYCACENRG